MEKILQISKYYPPEVGGIEKMAEAVTKAVSGKYEMKILCFATDNEDSHDYVDGIEVIRCGMICKMFSQPISFSILRELKTVFKNYSPDYVVIHEPNPLLSYLIIRSIPEGVKLIVYWHSDIIKQKKAEKFLRKLYFRELDRADAVIATSPNYAENSIYLKRYIDKCHIIPNCVEEESLVLNDAGYQKAKEIRKKYDGKILCIGIGRMVPYKGFEYLAQVSQVVDDRFHFVVIGRSDVSTNTVKKLVSNGNNFTIIENCNEDDKKAYLKAADIFVFPSITKNEAFGIALAEGMYFGKPAVTYTIDGSGVNYVNLNGITGIEVKNRSVDDYAHALMWLADHQEERLIMGKKAQKRVKDEFLFPSYKSKLIEMLNNI